MKYILKLVLLCSVSVQAIRLCHKRCWKTYFCESSWWRAVTSSRRDRRISPNWCLQRSSLVYLWKECKRRKRKGRNTSCLCRSSEQCQVWSCESCWKRKNCRCSVDSWSEFFIVWSKSFQVLLSDGGQAQALEFLAVRLYCEAKQNVEMWGWKRNEILWKATWKNDGGQRLRFKETRDDVSLSSRLRYALSCISNTFGL